MEGNNSLTVSFITWWYGEACMRLFKYVRAAYIYTADLFSVKICLSTLFAPWKRDLISYEGLSLQQKFQVWTLNLASRFIGMAVKLSTLLGFVLFATLLAFLSIVIIAAWLGYPLIIVWLLFKGFKTFGS